MTMSDPIADFLTRIRNANAKRHATVEIPASKIKTEIASILKNEGFVKDVKVVEDETVNGTIRITLKYGSNNERVISGLKRISKPGLRVYANAEEMPKVLNGLGIAVVSSSDGIISDKEARQKHIGGEVLAYVW